MPRVAAVVFSYCPADPRVRREAEAMAETGYDVDIICLRGPGQSWVERTGGTRVVRLPVTRKRGGKIRYLWEYFAFILLSMFVLTGMHLRYWYRIIHVHNMPDVLVFSALVPRLLGAKVILDLHDPMPEVFVTKYDLAEDHLVIRVLRMLERISIRFASIVLTPNIGFRDLFVKRGCPPNKIHVIMNSPQESIFGDEAATKSSSAQPTSLDHFKIMFHGTVVERHGLGTALQSLALLRESHPDLQLLVYGEGDYVERFLELVAEFELSDMVEYHGFVSLETIAEAIEGIDLGLIPNMRSVFTEINMPTRIFEYLCKGKPVIAPRTQGILDYFGDDDIFFFEPDNAESLTETIKRARSDAGLRSRVLSRGDAIYKKHSWRNEREKLLDLVQKLDRKS